MRTRSLKSYVYFALTALIVALMVSPSAKAQTRDLAELKGQVRDSQSKAISGAQVTLTNKDTGIARDTRTDAGGNYSFLGVPLTGHYIVAVKASQFAPAERSDIQFKADEAATVDFMMNIAGSEQQVTVYGTTEGVETDSNQISDRFDAQKIEGYSVAGGQADFAGAAGFFGENLANDRRFVSGRNVVCRGWRRTTEHDAFDRQHDS